MKADPGKRDSTKHCEFHRDHGQRTDDCIQLRKEVGYLIRRGHLRRFVADECKTHLCFEFISHAILCILYPYSCKTHEISSKIGFVGLLMKIK